MLAGQVLLNGDFEANNVATWDRMCPSNWTCSGGSSKISRCTDTTWGGGGCPSGLFYLAYQAVPHSISQTLPASLPPRTYRLQFSARNRPSRIFGLVNVTVSFGGLDVFTVTPPRVWTTYELLVTATSSATVLKFSSAFYSGPIDVAMEFDNLILTGEFPSPY